MSLGELSVRLDKDHFALVVASQKRHTKEGTVAENSVILKFKSVYIAINNSFCFCFCSKKFIIGCLWCCFKN